ncbi:MAG TPA: VWA domain-containing protein [Terriglobales bacterium]|nr:VWA domain-containing protein [Terriglobales bacterium]
MNPSFPNSFLSRAAAILCLAALPAPFLPAQQQLYKFKTNSELVLVNVVARDSKGDPIRDLTAGDFTILEDNKPQKLSAFDLEDVDVAAIGEEPAQPLLARPKAAAPQPAAVPDENGKIDLRDRRLMVLFFDLTSMQPEEVARAVAAAQKFLDQQMTPADMVGIVSLASSLQVDQDFTADREALRQSLSKLNPDTAQGFAEGSTGTTEGTADTGEAFTPDDTEYNVFNTDRRLEALQSISESLARVEQKKSIIYFSSGMTQSGLENEAELRNTVNAAVRSNVSIYTMDLRGLEAVVPGGSAQQASLRGTSAYSGASVRNAMDSNFASQETLTTLASDTGGRAFLDSNDFNQVFTRVQQDTRTYYVLAYRSTNPARDGRFRRISVKVNRPGVKLEFRKGYYAPRDFAHSNRDDREQQLEDELSAELSSTDLDVFLAASYFRVASDRYYVPVSIVIPGSEIPFVRSSDKDKATLDIIGVLRDELKRPVGQARDTVKLAVEGAQDVRRKNVQYDTSFLLPPGKYHFKFVLRENETGRLGSFETDVTLPDLKKAPLKMSAVLMGTQIRPAKKKAEDPLVRDGNELVPNVTHVFSSDQHLYLYYEVYEPAKAQPSVQEGRPVDLDRQDAGSRRPAAPIVKIKNPIHLLTSIAFFQGKTKAYETPLVEARQLTAPDRKAAVFQFDVPLAQLRPGFYTCQVNVIDDAAGTFTFPRLVLLVRPPKTQVAASN